MSYIKSDTFIEICYECEFDVKAIGKALEKHKPGYDAQDRNIRSRIGNYRRKGLLPLESGNSVATGELLKGTSTQYGPNGEIKQQWVKTDVDKEKFLEAFRTTIAELASTIPSIPTLPAPAIEAPSDLATLYISNDVHFGALVWGEETESDYSTDIASERLRSAYDYLFSCSPDTEIGIICDLGDLLEVDSFSNTTPKSGNPLDVDSRYQRILRTAYEALIYAVTKALEKHKTVHFYNIEGNHDITTGSAIREIMRMAFKNNPRVIIDDTPKNIKYHQHGQTLLGFAHGDNMKMAQAGETMAYDKQDVFSQTKHRFFHFGHNHKHSVIDGKLCKIESHRNIAPLNSWAYANGYRRGIGTMSSITYSAELGEVSRQLFNVTA